jgi:hypothetical protein
MTLTMSSLAFFYNGQIGFTLDGRAYRCGLNGEKGIRIEGPDCGTKKLTVHHIWLVRGNQQVPDIKKQMWRKCFEYPTLSFQYSDVDVVEEEGAVVIYDTEGSRVVLYPPNHPDCISLHDIY